MDRVFQLKHTRMALQNEAVAVAERIEAQTATVEDTARAQELPAEIAAIDASIAEAERLRSLAKPLQVSGMRDLEAEKPVSLGEILQGCAAMAGVSGLSIPKRMQAASGMSVGVPSDGGFLVAQEYTTRLLNKAIGRSQLINLCDNIPVGEGADGIEAPYVAETSRANGSRWGGVRVYRRAEAATVTATKPALGLFQLRLEDLMGIAYATERLLRDASALEAIFTRAFASEFAFKVDDELIRGTGAGEFLGVLNSPALISVAKEPGQAAKTITTRNISDMWSRMPAPLRGEAVWLYNQDCEPQLDELSIPVGTAALEPRFVAYGPDGVMRIKGRPAIAIEQCETLGTVGDILLVNLGEVALIQKGMESAQSIHLLFLYNERAFRWVYPINAKPKWETYVTPFKGSNTLSPFVALATRA
jgi:HK97 family phage major capsid protein